MKNLLLLLALLSAAMFSAQNIVLTGFSSGFTAPVEITNANDTRLLVVQQNGMIKIVQPDGSVNTTNF